jgi:GTP-binding protein
MVTPLIALVGRPNVGKSRLFNRMTRTRSAIVVDKPGITRDRQYGDGEWYGHVFNVVDTGGFDPHTEDVLLVQMRSQARLAIEEADIVFFLVDGREGITSSDLEIAQLLRMTDKPVYPVVNKIDGPKHEPLIGEFWELGFPRVFGLSAEHGFLMDDLMDDVVTLLPTREEVEAEYDGDGPLRVAVIGKPNAGKSTLVNRFLKTDRLLTSHIPGTTRDAIDTLVTVDEEEYLFIDTAGIRRRRSISLLEEKFSVVQAFKAIDRAEVVLYLLDAEDGLTEQDQRLIRLCKDKGKPHILLVNKWDLVEKDSGTAGEWVKSVRDELDYAAYAPIVFISALSGQRVHRILAPVREVYVEWNRRVSTSQLNRWLEVTTRRNSPPIYKRRRVRLYYASQVGVRPPTFMVSANYPEAVAESYRRFLLNRLREEFGFGGTPLKIFFRKRSGRGAEG